MVGILGLQIKPTLKNVDLNLKNIEYLIEKNSDKSLDLVVLPEFFSTGIDHEAFVSHPMPENGGEVINFISGLAKKYNTNILAGTIIEKSEEKLYNTTYALNRQGNIVSKYRKIHLYNYLGGTEGQRITAGDKEVVVDFDFGKVGLGICYDIRYPVHYKKLVKMGAQIVVLPTAWTVPNEIFDDINSRNYAKDMWIAMNRTRAFDNMVYTVSVNQFGKINGEVSGLGSSVIVSPVAEIVSIAHDFDKSVYAKIDLSIVEYLKSIYPIAQID